MAASLKVKYGEQAKENLRGAAATQRDRRTRRTLTCSNRATDGMVL